MSLLTKEIKAELETGFYETLIHSFKSFEDSNGEYIVLTLQLKDEINEQYVFIQDRITEKRVNYIIKNLSDQFGISFKTLGECLTYGTIPSTEHKSGKNHSFIIGLSYSEKYGRQIGYKAVSTDILKVTEPTITIPAPIPFAKKNK